jgi:hypothetical protein
MPFNVWIEIEEVDEDGDEVDMIDTTKLGQFETLEEAEDFCSQLT